VGGIALGLAAAGKRVVGVEVAREAVADAQRAAQRSGSSAQFLVGDAATGLPDAAAVLGGLDAAVVDPPRKGLSAATRGALLAAAPRELVYVSCEPATLARDLAELGARYDVARVAAFDLMPGTPEVETVVTLQRR
jgi:23S rRNA (uracil1939-C5)-methyltransferase